LLRILRVLRLIKLVRLVRASRLFKRWETRLEINYIALTMAKCIVMIVLASHWFACVWGLQASLMDSPRETWLGYQRGDREHMYCREYVVEDGAPYDALRISSLSRCDKDGSGPGQAADEPGPCWECDSVFSLYVASLYFSMMTITSIGYGDLAATPRNTVEQGIAIMLMLFGAMAWGQVIATFCRIIANMNPESSEFMRRMDELNRFMRAEMLPPEMRRRLREYYHQTRHLQVHAANRQLLQMLSPALQGEVVWCTNQRWLRRVWFFSRAEHQFMVEVALALVPMVFSPGEIAHNGYMYIVHRGIALYGGRVLSTGMVWGEDMILRAAHLQRPWCARAMNYLEVYMIDREELLDIARMFPATYIEIRRCAVRLAMRRQFILAAKLIAAGSGTAAALRREEHLKVEQAASLPMSEIISLQLQQQRITSQQSAKAGSFFAPKGGEPTRRSPELKHQHSMASLAGLEQISITSPGFVGPSDFGVTVMLVEGSDEGGAGDGDGGEEYKAVSKDPEDPRDPTFERLDRVTSLLREKDTVANRSRARGLGMGRDDGSGGGGGGGGGGGASRFGGLNEDDSLLLTSMATELRQLRILIPARGPEAVAGAALTRLASDISEMRASQERQVGLMTAELAEVRAEIARLRPPR